MGRCVLSFLASAAFLAANGCAAFATAMAPNVNTNPTALKQGNYVLDCDHAALMFKVGHLGFSKFAGRFERFDVSLDFDEDAPENSQVEAVIDMTSLDVANDDFANTLMGPNWFDANQFPETLFRSTSIEITGDNTGVMIGDLTMHGVTRPVSMDVTFNGGGYDRLRGAYVVGMSARAQVDRTEFGVDRFQGLVSDIVELEIEAEFVRRRDGRND